MTEPPWSAGSAISRLPSGSRAALLRAATPVRFAPGERLPNDRVHIIGQGFAAVNADDPARTLLAVRGPGDIVVEAGATACGVVAAHAVAPSVFDGHLREVPGAESVQVALAERLPWEGGRGYLGFPVGLRVARVLLDLTPRHGLANDDGAPLTQLELAAMVGAREATTQRALRELREAGIIHTRYRRIVVVDLERLRATAELDDEPGRPR